LITNRALVNEPEITMGKDEFGSRFYEGAAAGTVMLGEPPRTEEFDRQFGWSDAVIQLPIDSPDIGEILADLDRDPERLARIRRDNSRNAALRHDWVYRLRAVFETLHIARTQAMLAREERLRALATQASAAPPGEDQAPFSERVPVTAYPRHVSVAVHVKAPTLTFFGNFGTHNLGKQMQSVRQSSGRLERPCPGWSSTVLALTPRRHHKHTASGLPDLRPLRSTAIAALTYDQESAHQAHQTTCRSTAARMC
jgi:hypothetical protein